MNTDYLVTESNNFLMTEDGNYLIIRETPIPGEFNVETRHRFRVPPGETHFTPH